MRSVGARSTGRAGCIQVLSIPASPHPLPLLPPSLTVLTPSLFPTLSHPRLASGLDAVHILPEGLRGPPCEAIHFPGHLFVSLQAFSRDSPGSVSSPHWNGETGIGLDPAVESQVPCVPG